ncbi:MAG TPA: acyl-CoA carboxylase epsilon subunit [Pseudonocardia sp.]|jgi:hypothetical protein
MADEDRPESETELSPEQRRALFRVVRGTPDDHELAALTAVLAASVAAGAAAGQPEDGRRTSFWVDRSGSVRPPLHPGPGAWRAHYRPR